MDSLTLEDSVEWFTAGDTLAHDLCVADVDNDDIIDIVTGGWTNDTTTLLAQLRVWSLDLTLKDSEEWFVDNHSGIYTIHLENVDDDNKLEIFTAGHIDNYSSKEVTIWEYPDSAENQLGIRHVVSDHISTTTPSYPIEAIILVLVTILGLVLLIGIYLHRRKT